MMSAAMHRYVEVVKQYPGQQQVDLAVEIEVPGSWFGAGPMGALTPGTVDEEADEVCPGARRLVCCPWFEWVPSKANPADVPSRTMQWQELYDTLELRWWPGNLQLPDHVSSWMP